MFDIQDREPSNQQFITSLLDENTTFPHELAILPIVRPFYIEISMYDISYGPIAVPQEMKIVFGSTTVLDTVTGANLEIDYAQPLRFGPFDVSNLTAYVQCDTPLVAGDSIVLNISYCYADVPAF